MAPKRKSAAAPAASETPKKTKAGLAVGDELPDLGLLETDEPDHTVDLKEVAKDKGVVIFCYPKANTAGCTTQACGFRDSYEAIEAAGFEIFGMSPDKPKAQASWKAKHKLPYKLLCDPSMEALKKLGVAKGPKSINRSHIVVEKGGKVVAVEYSVTPKDSIAKATAKATEYVAAASGKAAEAKETAAEKAADAKETAAEVAGEAKEAEGTEKAVKVTLTVDGEEKVSLVIDSEIEPAVK